MSAQRTAARPKRGGEEFARTHYLDAEGSSSKKPRFDVRNPSALVPDAPEKDAILEADEIGKRGQQTKRNAVNIDGYESDSSNEGFDGRVEAKAKETQRKKKNEPAGPGAGSVDEEEQDMFADLDEVASNGNADEEVLREGKKPSKGVRFLETDEIEGQVAASKGGGHVSADFSLRGQNGSNPIVQSENRDAEVESSSESDVDEAERAQVPQQLDEEIGAGGKKEHAPTLDAFNMKAEQEEGRFDASGNFVRKAADPDAVHDSWLEGVSKKDMKKAKEASDKRDEERRQKAIADDAVLTSDILKTLIPCLERGETILEALARLGRGKPKKPKWQNKNKPDRQTAKEIESDAAKAAEDRAEALRREAVETITGAADQLLTRGQAEIYDVERESLMRQYRRETGEDYVDPPRRHLEEEEKDTEEAVNEGSKQWDYRWVDARDGVESHGPYDGALMLSWSNAGYFGDGVEFRQAGGSGDWHKSANFV